jgi:hypothetical protein
MAASPDHTEEDQKGEQTALIKHPLQRNWTMWFDSALKQQDRASTQANWSNCLREVLTISTVEDFWGYEYFLREMRTFCFNSLGQALQQHRTC